MILELLAYQEELAGYNTKLLKETPFNEALAHITLGIIEEIDEYLADDTFDELGDVLAYTTLGLSLLNEPAILPNKPDICRDSKHLPGLVKRVMRGDSKKNYKAEVTATLIDLLWCIRAWMSETYDDSLGVALDEIEELAEINIKKIRERVATTGFVKD
jgi:hypothetical protein